MRHLAGKGETWPLYAAVAIYAMKNLCITSIIKFFSPFELLFVTTPQTYLT